MLNLQHRVFTCPNLLKKKKIQSILRADLRRRWTFVPRRLLQQKNTNTEITQGLNLVISSVGL